MRIKPFLFLLIASIIVCGCGKDYLDINEENPNQTQNPPINGLLANVTYQTGLNVNRAANVTAYYTQQLASPNASSGSDIYDNVDRSSLWYNIYNTVQDIRVMQNLAVNNGAYRHIGVAKVLEAFNMSMLIDFFGDAPYSQAWDPTVFNPTYDTGEEIFNKSLVLLDEAIVEFNKPNPVTTLNGPSDLIHGGKVDNWIKTANALKARLLNRLSKTPAYNRAAILTALGSAYKSNADDAQITSFNGRSPWNQSAYNNTQLLLDAWVSEQFVDALDGTTFGVVDPRLKHIATLTKNNDYKGTPNGVGRVGTGTNKEESYLSLDGFYSKAGAPLLLVTYSEMKFIEAEVKFANDKPGSYAAYLEGISANMDKIGVAPAEKVAYLANPVVAPGVAGFTIDHIFKEKYVAMFLQPEAWTDARRYDYKYKDFTLPANALLTTFIRRVNYPSTELDRNGANVPAVSGLDQKLWWDK